LAVAIAVASSACSSGGGADKQTPGISAGESGGSSGGGAPSGGAGGAGAIVGDGGGGTTVPLDGCVVETGHGESSPEARSTTSYTRRHWDPALRVLTEELFLVGYPGIASTLKWRYTADGREIAHIAGEPPFQHDFRYDEHGNAVEFSYSHPAAPDVMKPSDAPAETRRSWVHEYDGERLAASTETSYGLDLPPLRHVYTEDEKGRCIQIDSTSDEGATKETRQYDDQDRLLGIVAEGVQTSKYAYTYDDEGRVATREYWGSGWNRTTHAYLADGSETEKTYDGSNDVNRDRYGFANRTAECRTIDAQIGHPPDARCRVPRDF
jgi:YD repeat-containing protein